MVNWRDNENQVVSRFWKVGRTRFFLVVRKYIYKGKTHKECFFAV